MTRKFVVIPENGMPIPTIAHRIANARELANMSQEDLARALFTDLGLIHRLESGVQKPSVAMCGQLADVLHVDATLFMEGEQSKPRN